MLQCWNISYFHKFSVVDVELYCYKINEIYFQIYNIIKNIFITV